MQYGESTDVTDIVRMTFDSTDVQPRRQIGDRVVTTDSVRREYRGCEESTSVRTAQTQYGCLVHLRTQYGRPRCSGGFTVPPI